MAFFASLFGVVLVLDLGLGRHGLLLLEGGWDNVSWQLQLLSQVCHTLVGNEVVAPLPAKDIVQVALALEGLHYHHHLQVGDVRQLLVLGQIGILLHNNHSLLQQIPEYLLLVLLGH